jgi:hypothetical protein
VRPEWAKDWEGWKAVDDDSVIYYINNRPIALIRDFNDAVFVEEDERWGLLDCGKLDQTYHESPEAARIAAEALMEAVS